MICVERKFGEENNVGRCLYSTKGERGLVNLLPLGRERSSLPEGEASRSASQPLESSPATTWPAPQASKQQTRRQAAAAGDVQ